MAREKFEEVKQRIVERLGLTKHDAGVLEAEITQALSPLSDREKAA